MLVIHPSGRIECLTGADDMLVFGTLVLRADVRMLDGAPKTPWRLRDYDPSPQLQPAPKRARRAGAAAPQPPLAQAPDHASSRQGLEAAAAVAQALRNQPMAAEDTPAIEAGMQPEQEPNAGEAGEAGGGYDMDDNEDNE